MLGSVDARVAFASLVLVLATAVAENSFGNGSPFEVAPEEAGLVGELSSHSVTLRSASLDALDPMRIRLVVNGAPARAPLAAAASEGAITLAFLEGAGSLDEARLEREDGIPIASELTIVTPVDLMPGPRWGAAMAQAEGVAYVFGGALSPAGLAGQPIGDWQPLDAILRVDLATGGVRTQAARLPLPLVAAAAVWDPRPNADCPAGCAYVIGGLSDKAERQDTIVRFDPTSDSAVLLDVRLPSPRYDAATVWMGDAAYVLGGAMSPLRFDPAAQSVTVLPPHPLAFVYGAHAIFDERATPACPQGCAYVLGGRHAADIPPYTSPIMVQDGILRFDPSTGALTPTPARLPQRVEAASVAWDGERVYVLGGRTCSTEGCARSTAAMAFDPATFMTTLLANMDSPPEDAPALWYDGRVVIAGGKTEGDDVGSTARIVRFAPEG